MRDDSNHQRNWRKPPFNNWPKSYAGIGTTAVQKTPGERLMEIHGEQAEGEYAEGENNLDQWQDYFSKQFSKLFTRVGKNANGSDIESHRQE